MKVTHIHVPLGEATVTEPNPWDAGSDMDVASFAVEAVYRVELNDHGTAIESRDREYFRLVIDRIDADGDPAKTVIDALSVEELTKLRTLLTEITIDEEVSAR